MSARSRDQSIRESVNRQHCSYDDQGRALCCACRAVLNEIEMMLCASCGEIARVKHQQDLRDERERKRVKRIEQAARVPLLDVPKPWLHARIDSPEFAGKCRSKRLRAFAAQYAPAHGSAALLDPSGKGKTTACVALVHRIIAEGITAGLAVPVTDRYRRDPPALELAIGIVWTTARALVMVRRSSDLGDEPALLERCRAATLLLIDEWGGEAHDRYGDLMSVVDDRYSCSLPTIITSGLTSEAFDDRYGTALLRRVAERGVKIEEHGL